MVEKVSDPFIGTVPDFPGFLLLLNFALKDILYYLLIWFIGVAVLKEGGQ